MANELNPVQKKVVEFLKEHKGERFTLAEIAKGIGVEKIESGTTNTLFTTRKLVVFHPKERVVTCPHCGHKNKVGTYEIA